MTHYKQKNGKLTKGNHLTNSINKAPIHRDLNEKYVKGPQIEMVRTFLFGGINFHFQILCPESFPFSTWTIY